MHLASESADLDWIGLSIGAAAVALLVIRAIVIRVSNASADRHYRERKARLLATLSRVGNAMADRVNGKMKCEVEGYANLQIKGTYRGSTLELLEYNESSRHPGMFVEEASLTRDEGPELRFSLDFAGESREAYERKKREEKTKAEDDPFFEPSRERDPYVSEHLTVEAESLATVNRLSIGLRDRVTELLERYQGSMFLDLEDGTVVLRLEGLAAEDISPETMGGHLDLMLAVVEECESGMSAKK